MKTKPKAKTDSRRAFTLKTRNSRDSNLKKLQCKKILKKNQLSKKLSGELTSGGIVFRLTKDKKDIEVLLIQDSKTVDYPKRTHRTR